MYYFQTPSLGTLPPPLVSTEFCKLHVVIQRVNVNYIGFMRIHLWPSNLSLECSIMLPLDGITELSDHLSSNLMHLRSTRLISQGPHLVCDRLCHLPITTFPAEVLCANQADICSSFITPRGRSFKESESNNSDPGKEENRNGVRRRDPQRLDTILEHSAIIRWSD